MFPIILGLLIIGFFIYACGGFKKTVRVEPEDRKNMREHLKHLNIRKRK